MRTVLASLLVLSATLSSGCAGDGGARRGLPLNRNPSTVGSPTTDAAATTQEAAVASAARAAREKETSSGPGEFFSQLLDNISGNTPNKYLAMVQSPRADARWRGINGLVKREVARSTKYGRLYRAVAESDPDPLVRAVAIRALNRSRDPSAVPLLVRGLSDPNEWVRLEAAKALVRIPDRSAVPALLEVVRRPDESRDVRIAAVDALRHYKNMEVARTLAALLAERDFSIVWQSRRSLRDITRKDFRYDGAAWLEYLQRPERPLS